MSFAVDEVGYVTHLAQLAFSLHAIRFIEVSNQKPVRFVRKKSRRRPVVVIIHDSVGMSNVCENLILMATEDQRQLSDRLLRPSVGVVRRRGLRVCLEHREQFDSHRLRELLVWVGVTEHSCNVVIYSCEIDVGGLPHNARMLLPSSCLPLLV